MNAISYGLWALSLMPFSTYALDVPLQSPLDQNIQHTQYNADDVVLITAYSGNATHLVFAPTEEIIDVVIGFSEGWEYIKSNNHLFIKAKSVKGQETFYNEMGEHVEREIIVQPQANQWKTNLAIVTNLRVYSFSLQLGEGKTGQKQNTYRLTFDYPQDKALVAEQLASTKKLDDALEYSPKPKNWDYLMQVGKDSRAIAPSKAFDDGIFTYITFAQDNEMPAVFIVDEKGAESLINGHINPDEPNTLVIQRVAKQLALRLDKAVVGITNQAFGSKTSTETHTSTVPGVERELKGAQ